MDRFEPQLVTIFGGAGFVGTQVIQLLARQGHRIRVATRRPDLAGHTRTLGTVGQILPIQANVRNLASVQRAVKGADIVINLVAIGFERGAQKFSAINTQGAANVAAAARDAKVKSLVHMSALGVDIATSSLYAQSKLAGEAAVLAAFPQAVILRPSLMFGRDDGFFNMMGGLARMLPIMPLISGATRFQPVYVGDVAEAIAMAAHGQVKTGRIYELGGPEVETHKDLLTRILREAGRTPPLLPLPSAVARLLALPFAILPFKPLITADQVELLGTDNVVSEAAMRDKRSFVAFGITPTAMDTILPTYMWRFRQHGQFDRAEASHSEI
ncbi:MAG: complex subunit family protein [Devosia sp.]|uniref:complex I NDUFA9 subunit family protein n=1 Tax=Devosia sp. TaxID=1871048 RepID=UPI00262C8C1E|nr:complex I NDUFA9 subunit family protein [Devosia sp.]MDB5530928.1 complex subunit family protein [Devosia sp.]